MRIVAGSHRGRRLEAPAGREIRPTSDRTRETLFNILSHAPWALDAGGVPLLDGARVLDAFCGTGALGLEALSRGAAFCTFLDQSSAALALVRRNIEALGEDGRSAVLRGDALRPPPCGTPATLVFLDPPYDQPVVPAAVLALAARGWLAPGAVVVAETAAPFDPPAGFCLLDQRDYRLTRLAILRQNSLPVAAHNSI